MNTRISGFIVISVFFLSVITGCADLTVSKLAYSPANPATEEQVAITAVVTNQGNTTIPGINLLMASLAGPSSLEIMVEGEDGERYANGTFSVPSLQFGESYTVTHTVQLSVPQQYTVTATADSADVVNESREGNNVRMVLLGVTGAIAGNCILPIRAADLPSVTGGQKYEGYIPDGHEGIDFEFKLDNDPAEPNDSQWIDVIAPCGGIVTEKLEKFNTNGNKQISVNIKENDSDLNMFIVFEPDTPNTDDFTLQSGEIYVNQNDQVTQGQLIGKLFIRNPGTSNPDWYPVIHWTVFSGPDTGSMFTNHECPRDSLTPGAQQELDSLFNRLNQERLQENPSEPPLLPICPPAS